MSKNKGLIESENTSRKEQIKRAKKIAKRYCAGKGDNFRLRDYPTDDFPNLNNQEKQDTEEMLKLDVQLLAKLQDILYAQDKWALLVVFQAMDAAGKDGAIKHVMSGLNPQGCHVTSFKAPSAEELDHDFLWRCMKNIPERGCIGIFNRSYYEEVLIVRVHDQILNSQKIPEKLMTKNIWDERFRDIRHFESYLSRNGIMVVKFFLHLSRNEQKKRFLERIDNPDKNWKFSTTDEKERVFWKDYMNAYEEMIINTSTETAPWYVIPADNKPYARILVASAIIHALDSMNLEYPKVCKAKLAELEKIKQELLAKEE
jgi:PPK2 family polyphosphate:nucleotide phosphotransferase